MTIWSDEPEPASGSASQQRRPRGRPARLRPAIMRTLRRRITSGTYPPGSRLPTRRVLCSELGCSTIIMQQAMDRLIAEGFVHSDGRNGSFVRQRPPHLTNIGLILPTSPSSNRFWAALQHAADRVTTPDFMLRCWYDVNEHIDNPAHQDILNRVRANMFAGLIFGFPPTRFKDSPILTQSGIARVAVMAEASAMRQIDRIHLVSDAIIERAIAFMREHGRRRIAVIIPDRALSQFGIWQQAFSAQGLTLQPYWFQPANIANPAATRYLCRLLFRKEQKDRPDGLIVTDDNLVEDVTNGVVEAGLSAPHDLHIVGHCNFPLPPHTACPVTFFGFDAETIITVAVDCIRKRLAGTPARNTRVSGVFDHEREG